MPRLSRLLLVAVVASVLWTGCSLFGFDSGEPVEAGILDDALVVANNTDDRIWTFTIGRQSAVSIFWVPRIDDEGIAPGDAQRTPLDEIDAQDDEDILVYWWTAVVEDGERVPGEVRNVRIER